MIIILHYEKYCNFTWFSGVEILWNGKSPETMRKLCLSPKFPHQEIRWNSNTFGSVIIKELAKKCDGHFKFLGEYAEKYITFSELIKKELDNGKTITYKLEFIDSFRLISTSLSKLFDNLPKTYSKNCRDKNCRSEREFKVFKK